MPPEGVPGPFTLGGHAEPLPGPGGREQCSPGRATELGSDPGPTIHEHPTTGSAQLLIHCLEQESPRDLAGPTHSFSGPVAPVPSSTRTPWGKGWRSPVLTLLLAGESRTHGITARLLRNLP